ncbi:MAG: glycogen debranching protein GlgX [Fibrobacteres bacterium]|nr:glycogen debranching protein GlgX [Fibrobacterota bacterium]
MTSKKAYRVRPKGRDGEYATVEAFERKGRAHRKVLRFRQPQERTVPSTARALREGYPTRLGATLHEDGINFAVHAPQAREVFLVLFDSVESEAQEVIRLPGRTRFIHHGFVEGLKEGQLYAFRARGEWNPARGLRYNENKLLIDPYARAFAGRFRFDGNLLLPYDPLSPDKDFSLDERDSAAAVPKCIAYARAFEWEGDRPPRIPMGELIIYETHLKGFTANPNSGVKAPGTYLGFIEKIPWLASLGINAVELLPIHAKFPAENEGRDGRGNYWGYNTYGFFAPEPGYGSRKEAGCEVEEFKTLVKALHQAGIEVILDVVYNHTAEGNELGPLIGFKGLDNGGYYSLSGTGPEPRRYYMNHSGCGNTVDFGNPVVVRLALDSLRYWVEEFHVDGFRFDLATVCGRGFWNGFDSRGPFFQALAQDPVLNQAKVIAEPWDCGTFEQGNFPVGWSEWNAKFRDCARKFVKGDAGQLNELGWRLTGSADLFADDGRSSDASINFVTCHDGYTLNDLVSYNEKHNDANGEENRDGYNDNLSWNCGAEGESEDQAVQGLRRRQARNFFCMLLFSQGVPMIGHGDEMLRTQGGNNNAYCQDNPLAWMDWSLADRNAAMVEFVKRAIALRKRIPLLNGRRFFLGKGGPGGIPDITWYGQDGKDLQWNDTECRRLAYRLDGSEWTWEADETQETPPGAPDAPPEGRAGMAQGSVNGHHQGPGRARRYYFIFNMDPEEGDFVLPLVPEGRAWRRVADTSLPDGEDFLARGREARLENPGAYRVPGRATVILMD